MISSQSAFNNKNVMLFAIAVAVFFIITGIIMNYKLIYILVFLSPILIYLSIEKPFIFPLGFYVLSIPFDAVSSITGSSQGATLSKLLGAMAILVLLLKGIFDNKFKRPRVTNLSLVVFIIYTLLSILWAVNPSLIISKISTIVGLLSFYIVVSSYKNTKEEFEILKWFIVVGGILAAIVGISSFLSGEGYYETGRATLMIGDRKTNPNVLAISLLMPLSICIEIIIKQKSRLIKGVFIILFGLMVFCIFITGSRKALLSIGVIMIYYFYNIKQRVSVGIVVLSVGVIFISFVPDFIIERITQSVDDRGAGRLDIWIVGIKSLEKYWPFGAGLSNFIPAYNEFAFYFPGFVGFDRGAHNTFLVVFVELGVVGLSLLIWVFRKHYRDISLSFNHVDDYSKVMLKTTFLAFIVTSFFAEILWSKSFWLLLTMIAMNFQIDNFSMKSNRNAIF